MPGLPYFLWTLEDLWKGNQRRVSCIPQGEYQAGPHSGPRFKDVWELKAVQGRSAILIHAGNTEDDTEGCILVGTGVSKGKLLNSREAVDHLRRLIGNSEFSVTIRERGMLSGENL